MQRTKRALEQEAAVIMPYAGANEGKMYGPVLPQAPEVDWKRVQRCPGSHDCAWQRGPEEKVEVKFR